MAVGASAGAGVGLPDGGTGVGAAGEVVAGRDPAAPGVPGAPGKVGLVVLVVLQACKPSAAATSIANAVAGHGRGTRSDWTAVVCMARC
jgi:hypothetical protein